MVRFRLLSACSVLSLSILSAPANAADHAFDILAQPLSQAILKLSDQANVVIIAPAQLVEGKQAPPVQGAMSADNALRKLLEGSGLKAVTGSDGVVTIQQVSQNQTQNGVNGRNHAQGAPGGAPQPNPTQMAVVRTDLAASQTNDQVLSSQSKSALGFQAEEIEVTATRVTRGGYTAPTPTTVLNKEDLQLGGTVSIGDALNYMPSQVNTFGPNTMVSSIAGNAYFANLRGLGAVRTLTLIDGQRPVPTSNPYANNQTTINLNLIPLSMVQRVDTVTGGASAAWGSDAVAGVVNIILDTKFEGLRAGAQFGAPFNYGGGQTYQFDFAVGGAFGPNDRGHYVIGGQYQDTQAVGPRSLSTPVQYGYISNPTYTATNGQPQQFLVHNPFYSIASQGGLITSGPLAGTAFGPGGTPYQFQYGPYRSSQNMAGGDPSAGTIFNFPNLSAPIIQKSVIGSFTYDLLDNLKLKATLIYGNTDTSQYGLPNYTFGSEVIQSGNPFIPAGVQADMTRLGLSSIALGRFNADFGQADYHPNVNLMQGTVGAEGSFGANWNWDIYYSYARSKNNLTIGPQLINDLFQQALDVVTSPTTGKPVCRIVLTNPTSACVPLNVFGYGAPSRASLAYFETIGTIQATLSQNDIAGTIRGEPVSTWAGPVSVAAGGEYRRLSAASISDQYQNAGRLSLQNLSNLYGNYSVGEGFVEAVVPLLKDVPFADEFDFNGAFRLSQYNLSGQQKTWKLGFTDQVTSELMLRGTLSQDIRAPNISDLYVPGGNNRGSVVNPFNNTTSLATTVQGGNTNLKPELAHTVTYGGSYMPNWAPGLKMSVDWYLVDIHDEITNLSAQQIANFCFQGQAALCSLITPNPLTTPGGGVIAFVNSTTQNLAKGETSGLDLDVNYRLDLSRIDSSIPGMLVSRLLVNYVDKSTTVTGNAAVQSAGLVSGIPRWAGTLSETFVLDQWKFDVRARYVGAMEYSNQVSNNYNHFTDETYFDFGIEYAFTPDRQWVIYSNLRNVFDRQAPLGINSLAAAAQYDVIGRSYNVGVRVNF